MNSKFAKWRDFKNAVITTEFLFDFINLLALLQFFILDWCRNKFPVLSLFIYSGRLDKVGNYLTENYNHFRSKLSSALCAQLARKSPMTLRKNYINRIAHRTFLFPKQYPLTPDFQQLKVFTHVASTCYVCTIFTML